MKLDGDDLKVHYRHTLEQLGKRLGLIGVNFRKAQKIEDPAKLREKSSALSPLEMSWARCRLHSCRVLCDTSNMSAQLEKVRRETRQLPLDEQQRLAVELIDSAWGEYEPEEQAKAGWDAEIAKRAEDVRTGKIQTIRWEAIHGDLTKEFGWDK
ncbi:MAG: addiction module protein [Verrucomicrobiales bacterium]